MTCETLCYELMTYKSLYNETLNKVQTILKQQKK